MQSTMRPCIMKSRLSRRPMTFHQANSSFGCPAQQGQDFQWNIVTVKVMSAQKEPLVSSGIWYFRQAWAERCACSYFQISIYVSNVGGMFWRLTRLGLLYVDEW